MIASISISTTENNQAKEAEEHREHVVVIMDVTGKRQVNYDLGSQA